MPDISTEPDEVKRTNSYEWANALRSQLEHVTLIEAYRSGWYDGYAAGSKTRITKHGNHAPPYMLTANELSRIERLCRYYLSISDDPLIRDLLNTVETLNSNNSVTDAGNSGAH